MNNHNTHQHSNLKPMDQAEEDIRTRQDSPSSKGTPKAHGASGYAPRNGDPTYSPIAPAGSMTDEAEKSYGSVEPKSQYSADK